VSQIERVAVLGTGRMGRALAVRLASAGHLVSLGSRDRATAKSVASQLNARLVGPAVTYGSYVQSLDEADIAVLAVPYSVQAELLAALRESLEGMILIVATIALDPDAADRVSLPPGRSAALDAQDSVGQQTRVVSAFQTMMYRVIQEVDVPTEAEVWVAGDDPDARRRVAELSQSTGLKTREIGPLVNSIACEALISVTIKVGLDLGAKRIGVRLTGVDDTHIG
jgi:NADPH-dependent F420 reductase